MSSAATKSEQIKKKHFIGWNESAQLSEQTRIFHSHPVVGDYTNTMKTTFLFKFGFLQAFFRTTSLLVINEKFLSAASLCFHVYVYPCCLKTINRKFKSEVFFVLI